MTAQREDAHALPLGSVFLFVSCVDQCNGRSARVRALTPGQPWKELRAGK